MNFCEELHKFNIKVDCKNFMEKLPSNYKEKFASKTISFKEKLNLFNEFLYEDKLEEKIPDKLKLLYKSMTFFPKKGFSLMETFFSKTNLYSLRKDVEELQKQLQDMKKENEIDFLTQVFNRKKFLEILDKWFEEKENFSLVFFDLDHFKNINDTYGHNFGDIVLQKVAELLKNNVDVVGRFGGEEFIGLIEKNALQKTENIRQKIKQLKFDNDLIVTISSGIAEKKEVKDIKQLINLADERVYKAKHSGRDKVCYK